MSRDVGGTGFVSLGDYLGANQGVLDAGYQQDSTAAHGIGDTFQGYLGQVSPAAEAAAKATGKPSDPTGVAGYSPAIDSATKAQEMSRRLGSVYGMAGSGANPVSGPQSFNAALEYGAHGPEYASLSGYLGAFTPASVDAAYQAGTTKGVGEYVPPPPPPGPPAPPERDPNQPPGSRGPTQEPPYTGAPQRKGQGGK